MTKRNLGLAILSGIILSLSMPKPGWFWTAWVGLVPLLGASRRVGPGRAALLGLVAGCVYFGIILHWMLIFGKLPWLLLSVVQALWFSIFASTASVLWSLRSRYLTLAAVPAAWAAVQFLRSLGPYGFPWGSLAHTQANVLSIIQLGAFTGPWGIDFLICAANTAIVQSVFPLTGKRRWGPLFTAAGLAAILCAIGWAGCAFSQPGSSILTVSVVQPSLTHAVNPAPDYVARAFEVHRQMSLEAARHSPDLVVWPETALTAVISEAGWGGLISKLASETGTSYLVGGYDSAEDPFEARSYNAAHLYGPDGRKLGVYRKVRLVPYGEFVPLREKLPWLRNYGIRDVDVLAGRSHKPLRLARSKIGVAICFESLFPGILRGEVRQGAQALFVLTNDSWFGKTQAAKQHLMMARLRAVETGRYVVRAASTGISAIIAPNGRICESVGMFKKGLITDRIYLYGAETAYVRWGDWFAYLCALCALCGLAIGWRCLSAANRQADRSCAR